MNTNAHPRQRIATALLASLFIVGACGSEPDAETSGSAPDAESTESAAPPTRSESDSPSEPTRPDDEEGGDADDDRRILPPDGPEAEVVWIEDSLYVVVPGSSSCPPKARSVKVVSDTGWVIDVTPRAGKGVACTADLVPHRSRIGAPANAEDDASVMVTIVEDGQRSEPVPVKVQDAPDQ